MRRISTLGMMCAALVYGCGDVPAGDETGGTGSETGDGDGDGAPPGDGDGDDDTGDGDGAPEPDPPPMLDPCDPLTFESSVLVELTYTYAYDVADIDGQPGDEVVAYHQGEIISLANGVPTITPHPLPFDGTMDALLLRADDDDTVDLLVTGIGVHTFLGDGNGTFNYDGTRMFADDLYRLARAAGPVGDAFAARGGMKHYIFPDALGDPIDIPWGELDPRAGDIDGDGIDEVLIGKLQDQVQLWARDGDSYAIATTIDCSEPGYYGASGFVIGDLDVDGDVDLVCLHESNGWATVTLLDNVGNLQFDRQPTLGIDGGFIGTSGHVSDLVADLEGDGAPELLLGHSFYLRLGDDGNFACVGELGLTLNANEALRAGDIDNDGRDELVSVSIDDELKAYGVP